MESSFDAYQEFIKSALSYGYTFLTTRQVIATENSLLPSKFIWMRHDIDSDLKTTKKILAIEKQLNISSSFYFRLKTLDYPLMRAIEDWGSEASYHYEELSDYAKKYGINSKGDLLKNATQARQLFEKNYLSIKRSTGAEMATVAAHGDFVNRILKTSNCLILQDATLKRELGILGDVYDDMIMANLDIYLSDKFPPEKFSPISPQEAIERGYNRIGILTHPRKMYCRVSDNLKEDFSRIYDTIRWKINSKTKPKDSSPSDLQQ